MEKEVLVGNVVNESVTSCGDILQNDNGVNTFICNNVDKSLNHDCKVSESSRSVRDSIVDCNGSGGVCPSVCSNGNDPLVKSTSLPLDLSDNQMPLQAVDLTLGSRSVKESGEHSSSQKLSENLANGDAVVKNGNTVIDDVRNSAPVPGSGSNIGSVLVADRSKADHRRSGNRTTNAAQKTDTKNDNFRPLGRLLHDLGLELVREQVYRDLIEIQAVKDADNRLEEREKCQLVKLVEARERLVTRNAPYHLPEVRCQRCNFSTSSANVLKMHHQYGTTSRSDPCTHVCCLCTGHGFRTRVSAQFLAHLALEHHVRGRLLKKPANYTCVNCPFEHRHLIKYQAHMEKCLKKFPLTCNLQPLPGDCDIALVYRAGEKAAFELKTRSVSCAAPVTNSILAHQCGQQAWPVPATTAGQANTGKALLNPAISAGSPSVRTLLNTLRAQQAADKQKTAETVAAAKQNSGEVSLVCEICGRVVDGREALWSHFRVAHHVELSRATMKDQDPWMKCDVCSSRFWTYQGLSRHLLLAHNRSVAAGQNSQINASAAESPVTVPLSSAVASGICHICGGSQTSNPLSHFSAYHNITLLEMYHAKLCCLCHCKLSSGRAFEEHMVGQHSDIFANYDVLRTVLQALTTARYFKTDESKLAAKSGPVTSSLVKASSASVVAQPVSLVKNVASVNSANTVRGQLVKKRSQQDVKTLSVPSAETTQHAVQEPNICVSNAPATLGKKRKGQCKYSTDSVDNEKTPEKHESNSEAKEEREKMYGNLTEIGRPTLRSMRQKLTSSPRSSPEKTAEVDRDEQSELVDSKEHCEKIVDGYSDGSVADDIPLKKPCMGEIPSNHVKVDSN